MAHVRYAKNCWGPFHTSTRPYTFRHPWTISSSSMRHLAIGHCMFDADHREPGILILFNRLPFIPSNILNSDLNIATFKTLKKAIWILMVCNICWTGWKSSNKYRNMYNCRAFRAFFSSQIHVRGCTFQKKGETWTYLRNSSHSQVLLKVIHPKYYNHLKKGAKHSHLGR